MAESHSLTWLDSSTLDSETFKGGNRIAHARRVLLEDGRLLRVIQSGCAPDGTDFSNVSYYFRLD